MIELDRAKPFAAVGYRLMLLRSGNGNWLIGLLESVRHRPLVRGALASVFLMGIGTVVGYLVQIFISRTLGAQEYGIYSYVLGVFNVVRIVAIFGFDIAAVRYVGVYNTSRDWPLLTGFVYFSRRTVLLLSLAAVVTCGFVIVYLRLDLQPSLFAALLAGCLLFVPQSMLSIEFSILQALRRVYEVRVPNMIVRPLILVVVLYTVVYGFNTTGTGTKALLANAAGSAVALALSVWLLRRIWPHPTRQAGRKVLPKEWLSFCVANLGQSILYLLLSQQGDVIIVGSVIGTTEAGLYSAASQIVTLMSLGVAAVNQFTSPLLAEYHNRRTESGLRILLGRVMALNALLSLPLLAIIIFAGSLLLRTFGPAFTAAYPVIVVLSIGAVVNTTWGGLWGDLLTMTGFQTASAIIVVIVGILNLVLTIILTPHFGIIGAAYATTIAVVVRGIVLAVVVRQRLYFWPWMVRLT